MGLLYIWAYRLQSAQKERSSTKLLVLFSADAFGTFGALDGKLFADEVDFERDWLDDARRYLTNIVGKYGPHIQLLLKKAGGVLDQIKYICPLHGPVWQGRAGRPVRTEARAFFARTQKRRLCRADLLQ